MAAVVKLRHRAETRNMGFMTGPCGDGPTMGNDGNPDLSSNPDGFLTVFLAKAEIGSLRKKKSPPKGGSVGGALYLGQRLPDGSRYSSRTTNST